MLSNQKISNETVVNDKNVSSFPKDSISDIADKKFIKDRCSTRIPFGKPVVPEVYMQYARLRLLCTGGNGRGAP
ncbi:hypothetical protein D3C73_1332210 [compost metagenome]